MPAEPVPTQVLKMRGSRWANDRVDEPEAPKGRPHRPRWVGDVKGANAIWGRVCDALEAMGLLSSADFGVIGRYSVTLARWVQTQDDMNRLRDAMGEKAFALNKDQPLGYWRIIEQCERDCLKLEKQMGLSPAARRGMAAKRESDPAENRGKSRGGSVRAKVFGGAG